MNEKDAVEQAYKNGYNAGLVAGACQLTGFLIANSGQTGKLHHSDISELAVEYLDSLQAKNETNYKEVRNETETHE